MPAARRVCLAVAAIAAALVASRSPAATGGALERPIEIKVKTAGGTMIAGKLTAWSGTEITGSFGSRRWDDLLAGEVKRVFGLVMDRKSAADWLVLGEVLLAAKDGGKLADDAFAQAKRLGAQAGDLDAARARGAAARAAREERERMDRERRLQDEALPDGATAVPWPVLSDTERTAATDAMRKEAAAAMEVAGIRFEPVETDFFILCGDLPRWDMQPLGAQLDQMYRRVSSMLAVPEGLNLFWGKAVILCFERQDTFRLAEAAVFKHKASEWLRGICHQQGPRVFISIYRGNDPTEFASTMVHETVHGLIHRYATPLRIPTWANEGFADWVARECVPGSRVDQSRRKQGLEWLRKGGDPQRVMAMAMEDGTWPGQDSVGYAVSYLMVDLMIADRAPKFGAWVKAVKGGKPWQQALAEDFGVDPARLAASVTEWYRTNDGAPRR